MNTEAAIALRKAEAKFTRAKNAVDGSKKREATYQKAKKELAMLRIQLRGHVPYVKPGDARATPKTLTVKATDPKKGSS